MRQRAVRARARADVSEAPLQADDLPEPLDVAAREWQISQPWNRRPSRFLRSVAPIALRSRSDGYLIPIRRQPDVHRKDIRCRSGRDADARGMERYPQRYQQAAEKDRIAQRVGRRLELPAITVERGERLPERVRRPDVELRRDRLEQADLGEAAERALGR